MEFFNRLGKRVDDYWRAEGRDEEALPRAAMRALTDLPPAEHVTPDDIMTWVFQIQGTSFPGQSNINASFGQPPITLFRSERFYIEALFWIDGTTAIHQHAFTGVFYVLAGS